MNKIDNSLIDNISLEDKFTDAYNIRKNGKVQERKSTEFVNIVNKSDDSGIDVFVRDNTKICLIDIPVIITESGLVDVVYNDFYIGKNSYAIIVAGCGIHSSDKHTTHIGMHRFHLEENAHVKYIEKHYGEGNGEKEITPTTEITLKKNSRLEMETVQIKGVDYTKRNTKATLYTNAKLEVDEHIMTHKSQVAKTNFIVKLNGKESSCKITSRSVAIEDSKQDFNSKVTGNNLCFAHVECDAIIKDNAKVTSSPKVIANSKDATLIHEAAIGKIATDQITKLMTLGLTQKEAEERIIKGFLK